MSAETLAADVDAAVDFLRAWLPDGPWCLTSIIPDGPTTTRTFFPRDLDAMRDWLSVREGRENLYFTVNRVLRPVEKKASKDDMGAMVALHVDVDPDPGQELSASRTAILAKLEGFHPAPSIIIDSGGGYQGFWLLREPAVVGTDRAAEVLRLEAYNRQLEIELGGDHCHNIDRIMRLPGTTNLPNKKKRAKGREPRPSSLVKAEWDRRYNLTDFIPAAPDSIAAPTPTARLPANLPALDVDALPVEEVVKALIREGAEAGSDRSAAVFHVACALARAGCDDAEIGAVLLSEGHGISAHVRDQPRPRTYAVRQIARARETIADAPLVLDPNDPRRTAREFVRQHHTHSRHETPLVFEHRGGFFSWRASSCYAEVEPTTVRAGLYEFMEAAKTPGKDGLAPFKPNRRRVTDAVDAIRALVHVPADDIAPPAWKGEADGMPPAGEILSCRNGLLHLPSGVLFPKDPRFVTHNAVPYAYDANSPGPERWLAFLEELWPGDQAGVSTLQEIFGHMLLPDTSLQKAFLMVGPRRSGKGTIARVLTELVGRGNVVNPTLATLGQRFGPATLIGKSVAIISDARVGARTDGTTLAERLLSITGEDSQTVDRKNRDAWTGRLAVRFLVLTNETPRLRDVSGALAGRFIVLRLTRSFYGSEDAGLTDKLLAELPGILNWAIEGWRRLRERGHFVAPESARATVEELEDMGSPVAVFVRECCKVESDAEVERDALYEAWRGWCERNGERAGDKRTFGRNLSAAFPVGTARPRTQDGGRARVYTGLKLADDTPPF